MDLVKRFLVKSDDFKLKDFDPDYTNDLDRDQADALRVKHVEQLTDLQARLYAQHRYGLLIVLQGMDTSGKDGIVKHVMVGLNSSGIDITSFKQPTSEELDHDYLWRCQKRVPGRGGIGIFNRSHYEEVIITRVHPELLAYQNLPPGATDDPDFWKNRYKDINNWEKYLHRNGIWVIKFFLHISKDEQKKNLLERIEDPSKQWKVAKSDFVERRYWDDYQAAYEQALKSTSTDEAPWYVLPSNKKWFARAAAAAIVVETLKRINPQYPEVDDTKRKELAELKELLEKE